MHVHKTLLSLSEMSGDVYTYMGRTCTRHNYMGHYIGHSYIGHNYVGHDYMGHTYMGHKYMGHNCMGHNSVFW